TPSSPLGVGSTSTTPDRPSTRFSASSNVLLSNDPLRDRGTVLAARHALGEVTIDLNERQSHRELYELFERDDVLHAFLKSRCPHAVASRGCRSEERRVGKECRSR